MVDLSNYSRGWGNPLSVERLFADVLLSSPKFTEFGPVEIKPKQKSTTASNVAGAVSRIVLGVGWTTHRIPTSIVAFNSCPINFAVFSNTDKYMKAKFFFPVPRYIDPRKGGFHLGEVSIRKKEPGIFSKEPTHLELDSSGKQLPGTDKIAEDKTLTEKLLEIESKGLTRTDTICRIKYDITKVGPVGWVEFDVDHSKKNWEKVTRGMELSVEDYVAGIFDNARSIVQHVEKYFTHEDAARLETDRMKCSRCGKSITLEGEDSFFDTLEDGQKICQDCIDAEKAEH